MSENTHIVNKIVIHYNIALLSDLLWKLEILSQASSNIIYDNNEKGTPWQGSLKLRVIFTEGSCALEEQSNLKAGIHKFWYKSWRDFFFLLLSMEILIQNKVEGFVFYFRFLFSVDLETCHNVDSHLVENLEMGSLHGGLKGKPTQSGYQVREFLHYWEQSYLLEIWLSKWWDVL